jgi:hypothetical protein
VEIEYPEIGICGLSCRLCPSYLTEGKSKCGGCKSEFRMGAGCPFITCALKRKGIEYCGLCSESNTCSRWQAHREFSLKHDTFVCYQALENNIAFIKQNDLELFEKTQRIRERLLDEILEGFNEGRSKRYYCIAATVLKIEELEAALIRARKDSIGFDIKEKSRIMHSILDEIAERNQYFLSLRK